MVQHVKWASIDNFHNLRKGLTLVPELSNYLASPVTYRAKVKLHGTCAGIQFNPDGTITATSRDSVLTPTKDNAGFARWVEEREHAFRDNVPLDDATLVLFGEWCGPKIQKGVAINQVEKKVFAVFAARRITAEGSDFIDEPEVLTTLVQGVPGCYVLPWYNDGELFTVDWAETSEALQPVLDRINAHVLSVEECDPWVFSQFGIRGVGEGLVFYPLPKGSMIRRFVEGESEHGSYERFSNLCFKAKGEKHQVVAHTKPAQADASKAEGVTAFAQMVLPPARLEQGAMAVGDGVTLAFDLKKTGAFLAWISTDVTKECQAELTASGLNPKEAMAAVTAYARQWYLGGTKKL